MPCLVRTSAISNRSERALPSLGCPAKTSSVYHDGDSVLSGLPSPFQATRYHSLVLRREDLPECLVVNAWTEDGVVMGLRHQEYDLFGVQFHPESVMTPEGMKVLGNFVDKL